MCSHAYPTNITVDKLMNLNSLNCQSSAQIVQISNDLNEQKKRGIKLNQTKQEIKLDHNVYQGIYAYQNYKTKHMVQDDFAVNFKKYGVRVIKIAFQAIKTSESESGAYYFIFEGHPSTVLYQLKKYFGEKWESEPSFDETSQGNTKLSCVYIG
ncbi:hypothetical protein SAMN05216500_10775 [Acinetobacter sp. DSM 11652]|nr:hypothetical protein SAMN05216500_10775 [Acinetobacter sp. DSM 11652]